jgi:hypothetical protein
MKALMKNNRHVNRIHPASLLVILSTFTHYEVLRLVSLPPNPAAGEVIVILFGTFSGHLLEIGFALAYYYLKDHFDLGNFGGKFSDSFSSYLYFSSETYTTIGLGDIYPLGSLRLITGIEALNGLLLIGWSASFTYLAMQKFWNIRERVSARGRLIYSSPCADRKSVSDSRWF